MIATGSQNKGGREAMILTHASIVEFQESLEDRALSANTIKAYSTDVRGFWVDEQLTEIALANLPTRIRRWLNRGRQVWGKRTTNRKITSLKSYCAFFGLPAALDDYKAPTPERGIPHPLPNGLADVRKLLAVCESDEQRVLIILMGLCGLRLAEALSVQANHISFTNLTLLVEGKGEKDRTVPIPSRALMSVVSYMMMVAQTSRDAKLISYSDRGARKLITRLGVNAGISRAIASHDLRMTFGTELMNRCGNIRVVQELLGHATVTTTQNYTAVLMEQMRNAVEMIDKEEDGD